MDTLDAIKRLSEMAGSQRELSRKIGRHPSYISATIARNSDIGCKVMAECADAAGMKLCICKRTPEDAIIIEGGK